MKELGEIVARRREAKGFTTQKALADALDKDGSWVSKLERGLLKETPPPELMANMSRLLDVPVIDLLIAAGYDISVDRPEDIEGADDVLSAIRDITWTPFAVRQTELFLKTIRDAQEGKYRAPD